MAAINNDMLLFSSTCLAVTEMLAESNSNALSVTIIDHHLGFEPTTICVQVFIAFYSQIRSILVEN